jgi:Tfp pilus assembly protein PilN
VITPNLATRPFLNTRPVWLVTAIAGAAAMILIALNLRLFFVANRSLEDEMETRDALLERHQALEAELREEIETLERVPWRSLSSRVEATNLVLREHAFSWLGMLDDIERVMPYDVRLTRIAPAVGPHEVTLSLALVAHSRDAMLQLLDNLIADPRFSNPTPSSEATPEQSSTAGYVMSLRVNYQPDREAP